MSATSQSEQHNDDSSMAGAASASPLARYYCADWQRWQDPQPPEWIDPTGLLLDRHLATDRADATALYCDEQRVSYRQLQQTVCQFASGLQAIGCARESRMLVFATDSLEFMACWLGAVRAGVVPATVSDAHKDHHLRYFIEDTACNTLFIDAEQIDKLLSIADDLPDTLQRVIVRGSAALSVTALQDRLGARQVIDTDALQARGAASFAPVLRHRNDICYMFYSGGTTGTPKGITHLAHDFVIVPERHGAFWEYVPEDIVLATSKKYFTHGLWPGLLIPLYWGACTCITRGNFNGQLLVQLVERYRPTKLVTVPTVIKLLLAEVEQMSRKPDFSCLKFVVAASEKMAPELFERFHATFGVELMDSIGSSEITYEWIANRQKEFRRGSLGKPVFGVQIKLTDEQGNTITTPNQAGDVWVNSVTRCFFYWRKFEQSQSTFHGPWTRTGDQLYFDEDGFFWFAGRGDDVFKVKGLWVSPIEVEAVITAHAAVLEAAVIGVDPGDGSTVPRAFVVLRQASALGDATIRAALSVELSEMIRRQIGGYKVPDRFEFVPELPRTPLMKINRKALREQLSAPSGSV